MSESMIERVARALCKADFAENDWESRHKDFQEHFRRLARAAIEAMREPTYAMLDAGYCGAPAADAPLYEIEEWWATLSPEEVWPSMIDAALSEKP